MRNSTEIRLRLPPFGRELVDQLRAGRDPNVRIFVGSNAWRRAQQWRVAFGLGSALVLPDGDDPGAYSWPRIDGVIVDWHDDSDAALSVKRALAAALVRDGVGMVLLGHQGQPIVARPRAGA